MIHFSIILVHDWPNLRFWLQNKKFDYRIIFDNFVSDSVERITKNTYLSLASHQTSPLPLPKILQDPMNRRPPYLPPMMVSMVCLTSCYSEICAGTKVRKPKILAESWTIIGAFGSRKLLLLLLFGACKTLIRMVFFKTNIARV